MQRCTHSLNSLSFCIHAVLLLSHATLGCFTTVQRKSVPSTLTGTTINSLNLLRGHCITWSQPWHKIQENAKGFVWAVMMCRVVAPQPHPHVANVLSSVECSPPQSRSQQTEHGRRESIDWVTSAQTELWGPFVVRSRTRALPHEKTPCIKQLELKGKHKRRNTNLPLCPLDSFFF